jgi:hypothetical protein
MSLQNAAAILAATASVTATGETHDHPRASLGGGAVLFIDPTKVLFIPFFRPQAVPAAFIAAKSVVRPATPGVTQSSSQISINRKPPKTQTGGIPNEG